MSAFGRLVAFAAALALVFGGAALAGSAFGPEPERSGEATAAHAEGDSPARAVRGLSVAQDGLRLALDTPELRGGAPRPLRFRILDDATSRVVRDFDLENEKRMHLVLARRDLTGFQHLHPRMRADGSWATRVRIGEPGSYRVFADFARGGEAFTLASDLRVDGAAELRPLPEPASPAGAGDGYAVELDRDRLAAGQAAELHFTVRRDGRPVRVQEYLGAGGHLVALREGDMAYLHVHPDDYDPATTRDEAIGFETTLPTRGRYRLFLQFRHDDRVRTAAFTVEAG